MKTGHSWKKGFCVFSVIGMIAISLMVMPAGSEAQSEWVQTTQEDFENATTKWNVDITSVPGNVSLVPSPSDWIKDEVNPVLEWGLPGSWDDYAAGAPTILKEGSTYKMWYQGVSSTTLWSWEIGYAESADGLIWSKSGTPVLSPDPGSSWEQYGIDRPVVLKVGDTYKMWYSGYSDLTGYTNRIGYAESSDGVSWQRPSSTPVLGPGDPGEWDDVAIWKAFVMFENGVYRMWYSGNDGVTCHSSIGYAESTDGMTWTRHPANPILDPGLAGSWDDLGIEVSYVERIDGQYIMWYNRHCPTQGIGIATSLDGISWTKHPLNPVLETGAPGSWEDEGVTWSTVLREKGAIRMWYSGDHSSGNWRLRVGHATAAYASRFVKQPANPVLDVGPYGSWDVMTLGTPYVMHDGIYKMWYSGIGEDTAYYIGYATSSDGITWTKSRYNPVLSRGPPGSWDEWEVMIPSVIKDGGTYKMWFTGKGIAAWTHKIGYATSPDGINWTEYVGNPVISPGPEPFDSVHASSSSVIKDGTTYKMWYGCHDGSGFSTCYATSSDGISWTKYAGNPILTNGNPGEWDEFEVTWPSVVKVDGDYLMYYVGRKGTTYRIGVADSTDGISWSKYLDNPVIDLGAAGSWDDESVGGPWGGQCVLFLSDTYVMWFAGYDGQTKRIGRAISSDGYNWTKRAVNPVLDKGAVGEWDDSNVNGPHVHLENGLFRMWFSGNYYDTGQMGYAESQDGLYWTKHASNPVLEVGATDSWDDAEVLWGSVVENEGNYEMWYSGSDGTPIVWEIGYASSPDGLQWTKPNLGLIDYGGNTNNNIVLDRGPPGSADSDALASPFVLRDSSGSYRMWFGCRDSTSWRICLANSTDGTIWTRSSQNPVLDLGPLGAWDSNGVGYPSVLWNGFFYQMWYEGNDGADWGIGVATSQDGINWTRSKLNPVLDPGAVGSWDETFVNMPMVLLDGEQYRMWFMGGRAATDTYKVGYASSQYSSVGTLHSSILSSGTEVTWTNISWDALIPGGALLAVSVRTGDTPVPDATWTDWTKDIWNSTRFDISVLSRYLQYRVTFVSLDGKVTPILSEVRVGYEENTAVPPSLLSPDDGTWTPDSTPTFSWTFNDLEGDTQIAFVVEVEDNSSFTAIDYTSGVVASSNESWTITAELAQGTWYWRVRTQESNGSWSGNSTVWSFEVDTPPSAPTGLVVEPGERGVLELTWDANPEDDIEGYNVFRSDSSGGSYDKINDVLVPSPSYNDTELPDGTTFYYTVTAVDLRDQESSPSPEASGTTVEETNFLSEYWWILLLIMLIVIAAIVILVVRRKKPEEEPIEEEGMEEEAMEEEAMEEEAMEPEVRESEMTDEERLEKLERGREEGHISEETYEELKKRYGGKPSSREE